MPRYRLVDSIDWSALNGKKVQVQVSDWYIIFSPLKAGEPLLMIAQAIKPRASANGQPEQVPVPVTSAEE